MTLARYAFAALVAAFLLWLVFAIRGAHAQDPAPPAPPATTDAPPPPAPVVPDATSFELAALERRVRFEHRRYLAARRRARQLTRTLAQHSSTREAIQLACVIYGSCPTLWRRARCETGGTLSPRAHNASSGAAGLFQFLPSTWQTTPFAALSIWDPYASALAAGWMQAHGRGGEWSCR
jgi:hypothetical protein